MRAETGDCDLNIQVFPVWDGVNLRVPPVMGTPNDNQLQGTVQERLVELAGRTCYDSLGAERSRGSSEYHQHIIDVGHGSVLEHANYTVAIQCPNTAAAQALALGCIGRPGVYPRLLPLAWNELRVTLNLRSAVEWDRTGNSGLLVSQQLVHTLQAAITDGAYQVAPQIAQAANLKPVRLSPDYSARVVDAKHPEEHWVSMMIGCSRGTSHALVRHGDYTAISQRSTLFITEDEAPWVEHPALTALKHGTSTKHPRASQAATALRMAHSVTQASQESYRRIAGELQVHFEENKVNKLQARKQARGAARGYLGNALYTRLVFSANLPQWKRMIFARCSEHDDAEIRVLFARALLALKIGIHGEYFGGMQLQPSQDGLGDVIALG